MTKKVLFSLFDHSGNSSEPYRKAGWEVIQVDIKHGVDILEWDYEQAYDDVTPWNLHDPMPVVGLILMPPCTDYALSGAKHFAAKDLDGRTDHSQKLVAKCKEIIDFFDNLGVLQFWQLENPMSRIHTLNPWLGKPILKFNPCDYAGYSPDPESDRYNKATWLWGKFNIPEKKRIEPIYKENPGWKLYGGKSERTKELRSITPKGFCQAFYEFNH
jgi:hypothetical protein